MNEAEAAILIRGFSERIAIELGTRARDGRAVTDDATVNWIAMQLVAYTFCLNRAPVPGNA
jgi:hypothetical protein